MRWGRPLPTHPSAIFGVDDRAVLVDQDWLTVSTATGDTLARASRPEVSQGYFVGQRQGDKLLLAGNGTALLWPVCTNQMWPIVTRVDPDGATDRSFWQFQPY